MCNDGEWSMDGAPLEELEGAETMPFISIDATGARRRPPDAIGLPWG